METSPQEFLGVGSDYWQVIVTLVAPIIAGAVLAVLGVRLGSRRLRLELQGRDAREQFIEQGLLKLSGAYEQMLGATRLNYVICGQMLKLQRDIGSDSPIAPRPDDLPELIPAVKDATFFAAIGPSSRIMDFAGLGELATKASIDLLSINQWLLMDIWIPIRGYFSKSEPVPEKLRLEIFNTLTKQATARYFEAERYEELPRLLSDAAVQAMEVGLASSLALDIAVG